MIKKILIFTFLVVISSASCYAQSIVSVLTKFKIEGKKKKGGCKVNSTYKKKRDSFLTKVANKNSSKNSYSYVYQSKNAAPPKSQPMAIVPPNIPPVQSTLSSEPSINPQNTVPVVASSNLTPNKFRDMTPEQRKKEVLSTPPTRELPPIRFISDQDEFSVVNMDSFMDALELINQGKMILVEGHTDDKGSDEYNLKLSMKRVEKIRQLLLEAGGNDDLISVMGYGERKPLVKNTNDTNRQTNRRIEFKVFDIQ